MTKSGIGRPLAVLALGAIAAATVVAAAGASHGGNHTFAVTVTIKADRPERMIIADAESDAPAQFCEQASIRINHATRGRDRTLFVKFMNDFGTIRWRVPPRHKGKRVYAEVSKYNLPSRPVTCLADRSRTIVAP